MNSPLWLPCDFPSWPPLTYFPLTYFHRFMYFTLNRPIPSYDCKCTYLWFRTWILMILYVQSQWIHLALWSMMCFDVVDSTFPLLIPIPIPQIIYVYYSSTSPIIIIVCVCLHSSIPAGCTVIWKLCLEHIACSFWPLHSEVILLSWIILYVA